MVLVNGLRDGAPDDFVPSKVLLQLLKSTFPLMKSHEYQAQTHGLRVIAQWLHMLGSGSWYDCSWGSVERSNQNDPSFLACDGLNVLLNIRPQFMFDSERLTLGMKQHFFMTVHPPFTGTGLSDLFPLRDLPTRSAKMLNDLIKS